MVVDALIDLDFICNQESQTEADSFENALSIKLSDDPELHAEVDLLDVRSMASDHAAGAQDTSKVVGTRKVAKLQNLPEATRNSMTPFKLALASSFDATTCQNHLLNLLTTAWVGKSSPRSGDPDKALAAHGENESKVQFHLIGALLIIWHDEICTGRRVLQASSDPEPLLDVAVPLIEGTTVVRRKHSCLVHPLLRGVRRRRQLLRYGFQRLQWRWHRCNKNKNPKPYDPEAIPAISEVLYAASKLFGDTGDFTSYYLNEGKILKAWGRQNHCCQKALWKAFKSSRMNWHVECAAVLLQNAETCLPFLHQLRVCTKKPNKLVLKVWGGLSCKFTMAAFAARTVFFLEIINPVRFVLNSLCKLADVHKVFDVVVRALEAQIPKRFVLDTIREQFPDWAVRIDKWRDVEADLIASSYASTESHAALFPVYVKALLPKVLAKLAEHRLRNFAGVAGMEHGFVTTDFIESVFGYTDAVITTGGGGDCVSQVGSILGGMNGLFASRRQQLATHIKVFNSQSPFSSFTEFHPSFHA